MKLEEYLIVDMENNDRFFDCMHGYIYSIPEYNVYQNKCDIRGECHCADCIHFASKKVVRL